MKNAFAQRHCTSGMTFGLESFSLNETRRNIPANRFYRACSHCPSDTVASWVPNTEGGRGGMFHPDFDSNVAGTRASTGAQTAWAVDALLRFCPASENAFQLGVRWLTANQIERHSHNPITPQLEGADIFFSIHVAQYLERCEGASWPVDRCVGPGVPKCHHLFPVQTLARYIDGAHSQRESFRSET
jgi:hypothetical protein